MPTTPSMTQRKGLWLVTPTPTADAGLALNNNFILIGDVLESLGTAATASTGTSSGNVPVLGDGGVLSVPGLNVTGSAAVSLGTGTLTAGNGFTMNSLGEVTCNGITVRNGHPVIFGTNTVAIGYCSINGATGQITIGALGGGGGLTVTAGAVNLGTGAVTLGSGFVTVTSLGVVTFLNQVSINGGASLAVNGGAIVGGNLVGGVRTFKVDGTTGLVTVGKNGIYFGGGDGTRPTGASTGQVVFDGSSLVLRNGGVWQDLYLGPVLPLVLTIPTDPNDHALNLEMDFSLYAGFSTIYKSIRTVQDGATGDTASTVNARTHITVFSGSGPNGGSFISFPTGGFGTPFYQSQMVLDLSAYNFPRPLYFRYRWVKAVGDPSDWVGGLIGGTAC